MSGGTQRIETDRLILRRFRVSDAEDMYNNWAKDPIVSKFLSWQPHKKINETKKLLRKWNRAYRNRKVYNWAIELKEIGQVIGSISVVKDKVSWYNGKRAIVEKEIGYSIGHNWWGKGIVTEALKAVIYFLFTITDTTRITAKHNTQNPASGKVMQKAGMHYEGTLRESHTSNYGIEDNCVYSILRKEYPYTDKSNAPIQ